MRAMTFASSDEGRRTSASFLNVFENQEPDQIALTFSGGNRDTVSLTLGDLYKRALQASRYIELEGGARKPVILLHGPGLEFLIDFLGCMLVGSPAIPLAPQVRPNGLGAIMEQTGASFILAGPNHAKLKAGPQDVAIHTCQPVDGPPSLYAARPEDLALIQYTSGTSGRSRGVKVTHGMVAANMEQIATAFDFRPRERHEAVTLWLPHFHDMGLFGRLQCLFAGVTCHLMSPLDFVKRPLSWLELVSRTGSTVTGAPNFAYQACAELANDPCVEGLDLSALRLAFCGAEPIRPEALESFAKGFAGAGLAAGVVTPCYGLAEATLMASCVPLSRPLKTLEVDRSALNENRIQPGPGRRLVSCGRPCEGQRIAILDANSGSFAGQGEVGEIVINGPNVTQGFLGQSRFEDDYFKSHSEEEAWFRTGDRGVLLDDELYVTGRIKTLVIVNGRNFDANDLEECAVAAHPEIAAAACQAIQTRYSESAELLLELKARSIDGESADAVFRAVEAALWALAELRPYRMSILPRRSLLRTTSGKLRRADSFAKAAVGDLRLLASWGGASSAMNEASDDGFSFIVIQLAFQASGRDDLDLLQPLNHQGVDSLALHRFIVGVRAAMSNLVTLEEIYALQPGDTTLQTLATRLETLLIDAIESLDDAEAARVLQRLSE